VSAPLKAITGLVAWVFHEFGPLLVFYGTNHFFGFVPAISASMAWSVAAVVYAKVKKQPITGLLKFSIAMTVVFGAVDLLVQGPMLFKYEAVVSNLATALFFGLTLRQEKSVIQQAAERRALLSGKPLTLTPDTVYFFQLSTIVWTSYFVLKALVYLWIGANYGLEEALALRVLIGNVSFYGLLFVNIFLARPLIAALRRMKLMPSTRA
jgi:intracellular septation protein A